MLRTCPQAFFASPPKARTIDALIRRYRAPADPRWVDQDGQAHALPRGPARPLEIFPGHQPGSRSRASRRLGLPQGHRRRRHRRFHPSGLVRRAQGQARSGRSPASFACATTSRRRWRRRCRRRAATPVRFMLEVEISTIYKKGDRTRKIHHLIYAPDFETVDRMSARLARIGNIASDGRPILGLDSRNLLEIALESGPARLSRAGAYLDAVVRGAGIAIRLRFHRRLLRRPRRPHLRGRDRALVRSADELAGVVPRPLSPHLQFRRAFAGQARARGDDLRLRARLLRHQARAGDRSRLCRHGRVLSRRRQVPPRRPSQVRGAADPEGNARPWRTLPGLRRAASPSASSTGSRCWPTAAKRRRCRRRPPARSRTWCRCRKFSPSSPPATRPRKRSRAATIRRSPSSAPSLRSCNRCRSRTSRTPARRCWPRRSRACARAT